MANEEQARIAEDQVKATEAWDKAAESRAAQTVESKDSDTFEADTPSATIEAYNLGNADCKVADAFPSLDLCRITLTGEPEEDEEDKDEGEEPVQVIDGDDTGEEVIEIPMTKIPEAAKASTGVPLASIATPQEAVTMAEPAKESGITLRE